MTIRRASSTPHAVARQRASSEGQSIQADPGAATVVPGDRVDEAVVSATRSQAAARQLRASEDQKIFAALQRRAPLEPSIPRTYEAYATRLKTKYAAQLTELQQMAERFNAAGGEARLQTQTLQLTPSAVQDLKDQLQAKKAGLDEEQLQAMSATIDARESALPHAGLTMRQLIERAGQLVEQIKSKGDAATGERAQLDGVMQASSILSAQINPERARQARATYNLLDTTENVDLVAEARQASWPERDVAQLAVDARNWLRTFFRNEITTDRAPVLFLRDEGVTGSRTGRTLEQVMQLVVRKLQEPGQAALPVDFSLDTATQSQLDLIYAAVIRSAATTNSGVNASMTGSSSGQPG